MGIVADTEVAAATDTVDMAPTQLMDTAALGVDTLAVRRMDMPVVA
jgi:hypothetical protein